MKFRLTLFLVLVCAAQALAQPGATCQNPMLLPANAGVLHRNHNTGSNSLWMSFTATHPRMSIRVSGPAFNANSHHIHQLELISGTCGNAVQLGRSCLGMAQGQHMLEFTNCTQLLNVGSTYLIRLDRLPAQGACPTSACNSSQAVPFRIELKGLELFVPPDPMAPAVALGFEPNRGQVLAQGTNLPADEVAYYSHTATPSMFLTKDFASFCWYKGDTALVPDPSHIDTTRTGRTHRVDMRMVGANPMDFVPMEENPGISNFYLGHCPGGVTEIHSYARLVAREVYPGIDLQMYSQAEGHKLYFVGMPGAELDQIRLRFDGAAQVSVQPDGGLLISTPIGATCAGQLPACTRSMREITVSRSRPQAASCSFRRGSSGLWCSRMQPICVWWCR